MAAFSLDIQSDSMTAEQLAEALDEIASQLRDGFTRGFLDADGGARVVWAASDMSDESPYDE